MNNLLTSGEVAAMVGIQRSSVYAARRRGQIKPAAYVLGRPLYDPEVARRAFRGNQNTKGLSP